MQCGKEVLEILQEINENITDDVQIDLLSNGVIDSFDIVNIVAALEVHFKIEFEAEDIVPENFGSVESIVRLVDNYKSIELYNENKQYIPINKGNYSMDTKERKTLNSIVLMVGKKNIENIEKIGNSAVSAKLF